MEWQRPKSKYDVVVIGAGPAGLVAGYRAACRGLDVAVFEKMDRPGKKLLITGKGRCNVINNTNTDTFLTNIRRNPRFMYSSINAFDTAAVMDFFEGLGVPLVTERGNRVFTKSGQASDIANALAGCAADAGCAFVNARIDKLAVEDGRVTGVVLPDKRTVAARAVIVATGGLSYPKTGSTGDGYRFAREAGHNIVTPLPSLVPLECSGNTCEMLQGLSLRNVTLTVTITGRKTFCGQGEMLFTHFGISGPLVLSASAAMAGCSFDNAFAQIDLKPALGRDTLDKRILRDFGENINREFQNSLGALLPKKLISAVVAKTAIDPHTKVNSISAGQRARLVDILKSFELQITGTRPVDEAVITAGGVDVKQIDPKTMMSKIVKNLHFAGEVLDVDALTGGFNLGIAFATGAAAGSYALEGI